MAYSNSIEDPGDSLLRATEQQEVGFKVSPVSIKQG